MYRKRLLLILLLELCIATAINLISGCSPLFEYEEKARTGISELFNRKGFYYMNLCPCEVVLRAYLIKAGFSISLLRYVSSLFFTVALYFFRKILPFFVHGREEKEVFVLVALNPLLLAYGATASVESFLLMLLLAVFYLFLSERYLLAAVIYFLSCLTSFSAFLLLLPLILSPISTERKRKMVGPLFLIIACFAAFWTLVYLSNTYTANPLHFILWTQATSHKLLLSKNVFGLGNAMFILPLVIYPTLMTFPFNFFALRRLAEKWVKKTVSGRELFTFVTICIFIIANACGTFMWIVLPWIRYLLPIIPLTLLLSTVNKVSWKTIFLYFLSATVLLALQVYWGHQFVELLS